MKTADPTVTGPEETVTPDDIESKLREMFEGARDEVADTKSKVITVLGLAAIVVLLLAFLLGRRGGRKRSAVVEIRRL